MKEIVLPAAVSIICSIATILVSNYFGYMKITAEKRYDARLNELTRIRDELQDIVKSIDNRWTSPNGRGINFDEINKNYDKAFSIYQNKRHFFIADGSEQKIQAEIEKSQRLIPLPPAIQDVVTGAAEWCRTYGEQMV